MICIRNKHGPQKLVGKAMVVIDRRKGIESFQIMEEKKEKSICQKYPAKEVGG